MNISSYKSPNVIAKQSPIHGLGLFAIKSIKKSEVIAIKGGHIIDQKSLNKNKKIIRNSQLQIADNFYIAPLTGKELEKTMLFINHSCEPNIGILGNIVFVAVREIKEGEEIVGDYAYSEEGDYKLKCNCRTKSCRKVITGNDWKRKDLQKKYGNYFSSYILQKINN